MEIVEDLAEISIIRYEGIGPRFYELVLQTVTDSSSAKVTFRCTSFKRHVSGSSRTRGVINYRSLDYYSKYDAILECLKGT